MSWLKISYNNSGGELDSRFVRPGPGQARRAKEALVSLVNEFASVSPGDVISVGEIVPPEKVVSTDVY